jgi:hypothetical protein
MAKFRYAIIGLLIFPILLFAQTTVNVPSDNPPTIGNLNNAIQAAIDGGTLSSTIFQLEAVGYYVLTGTINVPAGQHLTIIAPAPGMTQETSLPQIVWAASSSIDKTFLINCLGDLTLKNIWILFATTAGEQVGSAIMMQDDPLSSARRCTLEGCLLDYCPIANGGGSINIVCKNFRGTFTNCYWKNNTDKHYMYYGRALSFPFGTSDWHADSVTFENCTFANIGYVLMSEGNEYHDYVKFNHCTFLDVVMHSLEYGRWYKLAVNNCIFQNAYMLGYVPAQTTASDGPSSATLNIDSVAVFGFTVPFTEADRRILFTHSSNLYDPWLIDWMKNNPYSKDKHTQRLDNEMPVRMPMLGLTAKRFFDSVDVNSVKVFPYMKCANLDSTQNPLFIVPPTDTIKIKDFLWKKWSDNTDTNWAWRPELSLNMVWPLVEDLAYTNAILKTAGMEGFPLGDLYHWWNPAFKAGATDYYTAWKAQTAAENTRIATWLNTGSDPLGPQAVTTKPGLPGTYELAQNYPNPFNPSTQIEYSIPQRGLVSLKVYNLLGQEVATLFNDVQNAGNYVATFNGTGLASGVYLYRMQSGNASLTKKFVLMK